MSDKTNDGGPAYPFEYNGPTIWGDGTERTIHPGMSLRDAIAIQAMAGHLASLNPGSWANDIALFEDTAKGAYGMADAMLKAREEQP